MFFTISFGLTYSHIVWYQSEFLALEIRAGGSAIATTACWLANLVVSVAYLTPLNSLGATGTYGLYLGFIVLGYIFVVFCYPETSECLGKPQ
jgi:SP family myo-inositol transporter-like MFS transporter 13